MLRIAVLGRGRIGRMRADKIAARPRTALATVFVDCVENGAEPEVGFEAGRSALLLAEAARRSVDERCTVALSEFG